MGTENESNTASKKSTVSEKVEFHAPSWELVVVTPELAAIWLKTSGGNRALRKDKVGQYSRTMLAGKWRLTDQAVSFSQEGVLLNGHHRLNAVVEAKVSVPMWVVRGLPQEARESMDIGLQRTLADIFRMKEGALHADKQMALCRMLIGLKEGSRSTLFIRPTFDEAYELLQTEKEAVAWALPFLALKRLPTPVLAALCLAYPTDPKKVDKFAEQVATGAELKAGSGQLLLRNFLFSMPKNRGGETHRQDLALKTLTALQLFLSGKTESALRKSQEAREHFLLLRKKLDAKKNSSSSAKK